LWVVPPLGVYTFVHLGQPGYLLTVLPACAILVARGVVTVARGAAGPARLPAWASGRRPAWLSGWRPTRRLVVGVAAAGVFAAHGAFFILAAPLDVDFPPASAPWSVRLEARVRALYRFTLWAHTSGGLREREEVIATYVAAVRTVFDPSDTVLVTELGNGRSYPWFRHVAYYLPGFRVYHLRLGDVMSGYLMAPGPVLGALPDPRQLVLPASTRRLVWVVDYWNPSAPRPAGLVARPLAHGRWLFVLPVGRRPIEYAGYQIGRPTAMARPRRGAGEGGLTAGRGRTGA
jgi:hypothetical protein